jgi:pyruvate/2-oxoglutarate dehydrogenase complex dihydrolipoamide dehydrogenase (E3) component
VLLNAGLESLEKTENGRLSARIGEATEVVDMVLMSVGVKPETRLAEEAGLALGQRRGIQVDAHMRTNDPSIFAVGDAVEVKDVVTAQQGLMPLAGPANRQGRIAADNICGIPSAYRAPKEPPSCGCSTRCSA